MKILTAAAAFGLCLASAAHAQMDQSQSQAARAALNSQQAQAAQAQQDENAASQQQHDAGALARDQTMQNNDAAYGAAMHEHHRDVRQYHRAMREWREDVAACNAGDRSRCGHPEPAE